MSSYLKKTNKKKRGVTRVRNELKNIFIMQRSKYFSSRWFDESLWILEIPLKLQKNMVNNFLFKTPGGIYLSEKHAE